MNSRIANLAAEYNMAELFHALIHQAADVVRDMTADYMHDEEIVASEGVPTKAKMIEQIVDQVCVVMPIMLNEDVDIIPDSYEKQPCETDMTYVVRALATEYVNKNPETIHILFRPR